MFPKIVVPLQKYLRLTRLQHLHPPDAILAHLAVCLSHSVSAEAFLSIYRSTQSNAAVMSARNMTPKLPIRGHNAAAKTPNAKTPTSSSFAGSTGVQLVQSWLLHVLDTDDGSSPLMLKPGTRFHLYRAGVTLFCQIQLEPLLNLKRVGGRFNLKASV